jgi:hypothetical protein
VIDYQLQEQENMDPYSMFAYGIRSPHTKESYFRRLRGFFDTIDLGNFQRSHVHFLAPGLERYCCMRFS